MPVVQQERALSAGFSARDYAKERQNRAQIDGDAQDDEAYIEMRNDDDSERRPPILDRPHEDMAQRDEAGQVSDGGEDAEPQNQANESREAGVSNVALEHDENAQRDQVQADYIDVVVAD